MLFVKVPPHCGRYFAVPTLCRAPCKQQGPGQREKRGPGERRLPPGKGPEYMRSHPGKRQKIRTFPVFVFFAVVVVTSIHDANHTGAFYIKGFPCNPFCRFLAGAAVWRQQKIHVCQIDHFFISHCYFKSPFAPPRLPRLLTCRIEGKTKRRPKYEDAISLTYR